MWKSMEGMAPSWIHILFTYNRVISSGLFINLPRYLYLYLYVCSHLSVLWESMTKKFVMEYTTLYPVGNKEC